MKISAFHVAPVIALLTLASTPLAARAGPQDQSVSDSTRSGPEKATDAVVDGARTATEKTRAGLSKTGEVITDEWIIARVHERFLGEELLKNSDISVKASRHVVTLTGTVTGRAGRTRAGNIARHTEGVHRVANRLTIGPKHTN